MNEPLGLSRAQTSDEGSERSYDSEASRRAREARNTKTPSKRPEPARAHAAQARETPAKAAPKRPPDVNDDEHNRAGALADASVVEVEPGLMEHIQV